MSTQPNRLLQAEIEKLRRRVAELEHAFEVQEWGGVLFHESNIPQMLIDPETGTMLAANTAAYRFYGEALLKVGEPVRVCTETDFTHFKSTIEAMRYGVLVCQHHTITGTRSVEAHFVLVNLRGRHVVHLLVFDITDKLLLQNQLKESEERYRTFVQYANEGIWRFETEQPIPIHLPAEEQIQMMFEHSYLAECNFAFARMYGVEEPKQLVGVRLQKLLIPTEPQNIEMLRAFIENGYRVEGYVSKERAVDGGERYILNSFFGIVEDGMLVRAWGVQTDITEMHRLQQQLDQAYRLESLGRLAGGIAHDFNNVLTAVVGFAELARGRVQDETTLRYLDGIIAAAERAANLNRQLLAYARRQVVQLSPIDLKEWLQNTLEILRRTLPHNIRLETQVDRQLGLIRGDPNLLLQIVLNLVVNARDAMPEGGVITLHLQNRTLRRACNEIPAGRYVTLAVADTGVGIAPEVLPHIFEPFFSTKPQGQGTGLGLAAVQGAIKQLSGFIQVQSELGKGTCFTIYFPRLIPPQPPQQTEGTLGGF
ncbi:MAG: two-component system sensor histidine kinase NtrB [Fimbriimonadales bacterium]